MRSEIKRAVNIRRSQQTASKDRGVDEFFAAQWDELVIRFDENSRRYVVQRVSQPEQDEREMV